MKFIIHHRIINHIFQQESTVLRVHAAHAGIQQVAYVHVASVSSRPESISDESGVISMIADEVLQQELEHLHPSPDATVTQVPLQIGNTQLWIAMKHGPAKVHVVPIDNNVEETRKSRDIVRLHSHTQHDFETGRVIDSLGTAQDASASSELGNNRVNVLGQIHDASGGSSSSRHCGSSATPLSENPYQFFMHD